MDFTLSSYKQLLQNLIKRDYIFQTVQEFFQLPEDRCIILRHDVDRKPKNALKVAKLENELEIKATYYFRTDPASWDEKIIREISELGHEIGYHYENMDTCNGNLYKAWGDFRNNLNKLREIIEVKTICMHGSPRSKYDNKDIWKKYDYRSLEIIGEPYYDLDFDKVFYLTDTSRRWDGWKTSVRDKVVQQKEWIKQGLFYHSTNDIIKAIKENRFPNQTMFTMHPQRLTDNPILWTKELVWQNTKNIIKKHFL